MAVSETIIHEAAVLGTSVLVGAVLFLLYDLLRIFRRVVPHGTVWIGAEDFLYWLICTGAVFVMLYQENEGMVRGFALGGVVVGMMLYYLLFSRLVIRVNVLALQAVLHVFRRIFRIILGPFLRIVKKLGKFFRKELKKFVRAVRIGLCKL